MPTKLIDTQFNGPTTMTKYGGILKSVLLRHKKGTVCFPEGQKFGCGASYSIAKGETKSLTTSLEFPPISLELSHIYQNTDTWSYKSKDWESCSPEVCYEDSEVTVWQNYLDLLIWTYKYRTSSLKSDLRGRASLEQNCSFDPTCGHPHPNAPTTVNAHTQSKSHFSEIKSRSFLIVPMSFTAVSGKVRSVTNAEIADTVKRVFDGEMEYMISQEPGKSQGSIIGVSDLNGVNWIYPLHISSKRISLISTNKEDIDEKGNFVSYLENQTLPILAITSALPNCEAWVSLSFQDPSRPRESIKIEEKAEARSTSIFTCIWTELDLHQLSTQRHKDTVQSGLFADLKINLSSPDETRTLGQRFRLILGPRRDIN